MSCQHAILGFHKFAQASDFFLVVAAGQVQALAANSRQCVDVAPEVVPQAELVAAAGIAAAVAAVLGYIVAVADYLDPYASILPVTVSAVECFTVLRQKFTTCC